MRDGTQAQSNGCLIRQERYSVRVRPWLQNLGLITLSMSGLKLTIDYGVWGTAERSRDAGLWFKSILIGKWWM